MGFILYIYNLINICGSTDDPIQNRGKEKAGAGRKSGICWNPDCQKKKMKENKKKILVKVLAFIGMVMFIPLRVQAGADMDMASCATGFFFLCMAVFVTPYRVMFGDSDEEECDDARGEKPERYHNHKKSA